MKCLKILLVEDEDLIRMLLCEAMMDLGITPTVADSGEAALEIIQNTRPFDLLVTDIQLPGAIDGLDIARVARKKAPSMPIIFTTGQPDRMATWKTGTDDIFIPKPYRPSDIIAAIRQLTER
jgi:DNA-binding response OmpR family regulator